MARASRKADPLGKGPLKKFTPLDNRKNISKELPNRDLSSKKMVTPPPGSKRNAVSKDTTRSGVFPGGKGKSKRGK